jgi:hypothetical protein
MTRCAAAGVAFPRDFQERVRNIFKRLFRCALPSLRPMLL